MNDILGKDAMKVNVYKITIIVVTFIIIIIDCLTLTAGSYLWADCITQPRRKKGTKINI